MPITQCECCDIGFEFLLRNDFLGNLVSFWRHHFGAGWIDRGQVSSLKNKSEVARQACQHEDVRMGLLPEFEVLCIWRGKRLNLDSSVIDCNGLESTEKRSRSLLRFLVKHIERRTGTDCRFLRSGDGEHHRRVAVGPVKPCMSPPRASPGIDCVFLPDPAFVKLNELGEGTCLQCFETAIAHWSFGAISVDDQPIADL